MADCVEPGLNLGVVYMIYPVRNAKVRNFDSQGSGAFASRRGHKPHYGEDLIVEPGQEVYAPHDGILKRVVQAYDDTPEFKGVEIVSENFISSILYMDPDAALVGKQVLTGDLIGHAQDISKKYPGITKHIHWQVYIKPSYLIKEIES
jgi:murein DD-endopeptidase MepM/ murein hydrolase activator NlpD